MFNELEKAVEEGAKFLDAEYPGWYKSIDLGLLDLEDCFDCVLGQLFETYSRGQFILGIELYEEACNLGFNLIGDVPDTAKFKTLTAEWIRQVQLRRGEL